MKPVKVTRTKQPHFHAIAMANGTANRIANGIANGIANAARARIPGSFKGVLDVA
jgi:hypothetical protein